MYQSLALPHPDFLRLVWAGFRDHPIHNIPVLQMADFAPCRLLLSLENLVENSLAHLQLSWAFLTSCTAFGLNMAVGHTGNSSSTSQVELPCNWIICISYSYHKNSFFPVSNCDSKCHSGQTTGCFSTGLWTLTPCGIGLNSCMHWG